MKTSILKVIIALLTAVVIGMSLFILSLLRDNIDNELELSTRIATAKESANFIKNLEDVAVYISKCGIICKKSDAERFFNKKYEVKELKNSEENILIVGSVYIRSIDGVIISVKKEPH